MGLCQIHSDVADAHCPVGRRSGARSLVFRFEKPIIQVILGEVVVLSTGWPQVTRCRHAICIHCEIVALI